MNAGIRVLLVGPPGCGKTARIQAAAKQANRRLFIVRASLSERVDFGGCLVPDMVSGTTKQLPLELLHTLRSTKEPSLLFADDLGQAPVDVQASIMSLFDSGNLSPHVVIWGATNRPGDKAGVTSLCEPLRSRFNLAFAVPTPGSEDRADGAVMLGTWADENASWCDWALDQSFAPEIIAWHRSTSGRALYAWKPCADPAIRMPDFRSWETVGKLWCAGMRDLSTIAASIGKGPAAEFLAFARLADQLPAPDQVWMDPQGAPVPVDPSALYLISANLSAAVSPQFAGALCQYMSRMPRVYAALAGRDAYRRLGAKLSGNRHWQEWFTANQELFATT